MNLAAYINKQRKKYSVDMLDKKDYWYLSALSASYFKIIESTLKKYIKGKTLDAGAGNLNSRNLLKKYCQQYVSMDIENNDGLDLISDIQNMKEIESESFDSVFSSQVLEHVPEPWKACKEIYRILKPGSYTVITVPHLSGLHDLPNDYYRYTPYGIKHLMQRTGFTIMEEQPIGGLFSFFSHYFSLIFVTFFWSVPVLNKIIFFINKILIVNSAFFLDNFLGVKNRFPANLLIVGKK